MFAYDVIVVQRHRRTTTSTYDDDFGVVVSLHGQRRTTTSLYNDIGVQRRRLRSRRIPSGVPSRATTSFSLTSLFFLFFFPFLIPFFDSRLMDQKPVLKSKHPDYHKNWQKKHRAKKKAENLAKEEEQKRKKEEKKRKDREYQRKRYYNRKDEKAAMQAPTDPPGTPHGTGFPTDLVNQSGLRRNDRFQLCLSSINAARREEMAARREEMDAILQLARGADEGELGILALSARAGTEQRFQQ